MILYHGSNVAIDKIDLSLCKPYKAFGKEQKYLIDSMIDDVASYLIEDTGASVLEALDIVYHSQFYDKLMDLETGLYYQSPAYCYEYLKHEIKYGKAV